ncbi:hypothetical protein VIGAN_10218300 [Vigna angularis var. angularis]|uniref:Uncharacterized protein n=1 Tax=Vigna angularis var. angularis TaxID=157739 RepID=A0A0S3T6V1_PHAAN|nr:hypothetical protein VIGAN_10218300 [Vigna angularis var. angularis]
MVVEALQSGKTHHSPAAPLCRQGALPLSPSAAAPPSTSRNVPPFPHHFFFYKIKKDTRSLHPPDSLRSVPLPNARLLLLTSTRMIIAMTRQTLSVRPSPNLSERSV